MPEREKGSPLEHEAVTVRRHGQPVKKPLQAEPHQQLVVVVTCVGADFQQPGLHGGSDIPKRFFSCEGLKIRAHHMVDPAESGEAHQFVGGGFALNPCGFHGLIGHGNPNLTAELEAVRHGSRRGVDSDRHTFNQMVVDPLGKSLCRHLDNARAWIPGPQRVPARHRDPDLRRKLRSQFMKLQRGQQANHRLRPSFGDLRQRMFTASGVELRKSEQCCAT